jgi:hypothetical protein
MGSFVSSAEKLGALAKPPSVSKLLGGPHHGSTS